MSETTRVVVPYESVRTLAIGATDDESKKHRDTLEVEIHADLVAVVQPDGQGRSATRPRSVAPSSLQTGRQADVRRAARRQGRRRRDHRQPVPPDSVLEAPAGRLRRDRRGGDLRRPRVLREREGVPDVGVRHRAEGQRREPGTDGPAVVLQNDPQNPDVHLRRRLVGGTPVWLLNEASAELKITISQARANHWGAEWGRQADPPRRGLGRDGRVEPLRIRDVAPDPLRSVRQADALRHRRGRVDVRSRLP